MNASDTRVLTYAEVPGFLESIERRIADAQAFQWRETERGDLAVWIQSPKGLVEQLIIRQDLADEFRAHEGIRCAILDTLAEGTALNIAGTEKVISGYRLEVKPKKSY